MQKRQKRKVEALGQDLLLADEVNADLRKQQEVELERQRKSRRQRESDKKRTDLQTTAHPRLQAELQRKAFYVEPNLQLPKNWSARLLELEARTVTLVNADFIVCANPWSPSKVDSAWCASLMGLWILTPAAVVGSGAMVKHLPALKSKRLVWFSGAAREEHPSLWLIVLESMNKYTGHNWTLLLDAVAFAEQKAKAEKAKRSSQVLAVCSEAECAAIEDRCKNHVFRAVEFLDFVAKVAPGESSLGLAQL